MTTYLHIVDWLGHHLLYCPFKRLTGLDCPGCGMQRSVIALLRGDMAGSWHYHPAGMAVALLFSFVPLHLRYHFRYGALFIKILAVITGVLTIVNYFYKIYTQQLL